MRSHLAYLHINKFISWLTLIYNFTAFQIAGDREQLNNELENKTVRVAEDFYKTYFVELEKGDSLETAKITDSVVNQYRFIGINVYFSQDSIVSINDAVKPFRTSSSDLIKLCR